MFFFSCEKASIEPFQNQNKAKKAKKHNFKARTFFPVSSGWKLFSVLFVWFEYVCFCFSFSRFGKAVLFANVYIFFFFAFSLQ